MNRLGPILVSLGVALVGAAPARAASQGLAPLGGGADAAARAQLTAEIRAAIGARGIALLGESETSAALATTAALEGACDLATPSCLARVAATAAVDRMIGGAVDDHSAGLRARLSLVSAHGAVVRSADVAVPLEAGPPREDAVRALVIRLLEPALDGAFLEIVTERGISVFVDGKLIGESPLAPLKLTPGRHTVELVAPGFESAQRSVDVRFGATTRLDVSLARSTDARATFPLPTLPERDPEPPQIAAEVPRITVAVLGIENRGDDARVAAWVSDALAAEARKRERIRVVDRSSGLEVFDAIGPQMRARIEECAGRVECVRILAEELAVDVVLVGYLERSPLGRRLWLRGASLSGNLPEYPVEYALPSMRPADLADAVGLAVNEVFPDYALIEGQSAGVSATQRYLLDRPPVPAPVFLGAAGVSALSFVAAGGLGAAWVFSPQADPPGVVAVLALCAVGAGVGAGAVAAVMAPFTDWGPPTE